MVVRRRLEITGRAVAFITTTVRQWTPLFSDPRRANIALQAFGEELIRHNACALAYVLMPSHLHALLGFQEIERMSQLMQSFKSLSARRLKDRIPHNLRDRFTLPDGYRLWQPRFDDLVITSSKQFRVKAEYIHNNPVKAGLVDQPAKYAYSSAGEWLGGSPGLIPVKTDWW